MIPDATVTVHRIPGERTVVSATYVKLAEDVPEPEDTTVNDIDPQPSVVGVESEEKVKVGSTSTMTSSKDKNVLSSMVKATEVATSVNRLATETMLCVNAGDTSAGETRIEVSPISVACAMVAIPLKDVQSSGLVDALVSTPFAIVTEHSLYAFMVLDPAVNVNVAVDVPVLEAEAANVVVPHPAVVGLARGWNENKGTTIPTESPMLRTAFKANVKVREVDADVTGFASTNTVLVNAVYDSAADDATAYAETSSALPSVADDVRLLKCAACDVAPVVSPELM